MRWRFHDIWKITKKVFRGIKSIQNHCVLSVWWRRDIEHLINTKNVLNSVYSTISFRRQMIGQCLIALTQRTNVINRIPFSKPNEVHTSLNSLDDPSIGKERQYDNTYIHNHRLYTKYWNLQMKNLVTSLIVKIIQIWESWSLEFQ